MTAIFLCLAISSKIHKNVSLQSTVIQNLSRIESKESQCRRKSYNEHCLLFPTHSNLFLSPCPTFLVIFVTLYLQQHSFLSFLSSSIKSNDNSLVLSFTYKHTHALRTLSKRERETISHTHQHTYTHAHMHVHTPRKRERERERERERDAHTQAYPYPIISVLKCLPSFISVLIFIIHFELVKLFPWRLFFFFFFLVGFKTKKYFCRVASI